MLIKESEIEQMKNSMSKARIGKANKFIVNKEVVLETIQISWNRDTVYVEGYVEDGNRQIHIRAGISIGNKEIEWISCPADFYDECEHTLAFAMAIYEDKNLESAIQDRLKRLEEIEQEEQFNKMIDAFKRLSEKKETIYGSREIGTIDIIPVLNKKYGEYELSFKIGKKKMYKIKNIMEFSDTFKRKETLYLGEQLSYINEQEAYTPNAKSYLNWLVQYGETIKYATDMADKKANYHLKIPDGKIIIDENNVEDFMQCFKNSNHQIEINKSKNVLEIEKADPKIQFVISKNEDKYNMKLKGNFPEILRGSIHSYIIKENKIIEFETKKNANLLNLLRIYRNSDVDKYVFNEEGLKTFVSTIMLKVPEGIDISELPEEEKNRYIPKKLSAIMKLDIDKHGFIENNVTFCYGDFEYNPFGINSISIPRNLAEEKVVIDEMQNDGFIVSKDTYNMVLIDEDKTYEFLSDRINDYMAKYEVLISEEFKRKQVIQPRIGTIGVKIQNDLLSIDLSEINYDPKELADIMEKYRLKKKYYKLHDGSFLKLDQNENMDFLDKLVEGMDIDFKKMDNGKIKLPVNRSLYLNRLLEKNPDIDVDEDAEYKKLIYDTTNVRNDEEIVVPKELDKVLRDYQKIGFKWLKVLDRYKFGGILADDMGLRKNTSSNSFISNTSKRRNIDCSVPKFSFT